MMASFLPSAYIIGKAVHVVVPLNNWDAQCFTKVKSHLV